MPRAARSLLVAVVIGIVAAILVFNVLEFLMPRLWSPLGIPTQPATKILYVGRDSLYVESADGTAYHCCDPDWREVAGSSLPDYFPQLVAMSAVPPTDAIDIARWSNAGSAGGGTKVAYAIRSDGSAWRIQEESGFGEGIKTDRSACLVGLAALVIGFLILYWIVPRLSMRSHVQNDAPRMDNE